MSSPDVIVIGAGVLGLCTAAELAARGRAVTVVDPGGSNASAVAAGMIAPALESLLDETTPQRAALFLRARDLWPAFAQLHGLPLHREGAEWWGPDAEAAEARRRLRALGFDALLTDEGVSTSDDWRTEPVAALDALEQRSGVTVITDSAARVRQDGSLWVVETEDGAVLSARDLVIATGVAAGLPGLPAAAAARIDAVQPIKGQLVFIEDGSPRRVMRGAKAYVAPAEGGAVIGATMEPGRRDLEPDYDVALSLTGAGLAMLGVPEAHSAEIRVGVRGATADGLPLAGPGGEPGLHLALAPRRNGWLLGPLVARAVADGIEGRAPGRDAAALDPLRFD